MRIAAASPMPLYEFEPDADTVLDELLPRYVENLVYTALLEAAGVEVRVRPGHRIEPLRFDGNHGDRQIGAAERAPRASGGRLGARKTGDGQSHAEDRKRQHSAGADRTARRGSRIRRRALSFRIHDFLL